MDATKTYFMVPITEMTRAVDFYRQAFGLEPAYESPEWTEVRLHDRVAIAFHRGSLEPQSLGLGFEVADVDAACQRVIDAGGRLLKPLGRRVAIVADPDGNQISLSKATKWQG